MGVLFSGSFASAPLCGDWLPVGGVVRQWSGLCMALICRVTLITHPWSCAHPEICGTLRVP